MQLLKEFLLEDKCSYLQGRQQQSHYKVIQECSSEYCEALIERGYRRFGHMYFRPVCAECDECKSIKIDAAAYSFSKSARRVLKKGEKFRVVLQKPSLTQEHLALFDRYHRYMHHKKGWDFTPTTANHYYASFVSGHEDFGYEALYFDKDQLIAVDLIDILPDGISSIYFYYDPHYTHYSLGKLSLYHQIRYAKESNKSWVYLGYYVKECPSLSYKAQYKPYLTLQGRPAEDEPFIWS